MTITAKFASRCGSCGQPVTPGQKIEWTNGSPVRHTACGGSVIRPARRSLTNGDIYTARNGEPKVFGCSACTRGNQMCRSCQHDEYDA